MSRIVITGELEPMNTFFADVGTQVSGVDYVAAIEELLSLIHI